jgi:hypothetical protein
MMMKFKPDGDLGGKGNLANQATPEGGGSKANDDPQGNPVSIRPSLEAFLVLTYMNNYDWVHCVQNG